MSKPMLRATPLRVVGGLGQHGRYRLQRPGQFIDSVHVRLAPFAHVQLRSLGVDLGLLAAVLVTLTLFKTLTAARGLHRGAVPVEPPRLAESS